jgi:hypothetical protein
VRKVVAFFVVFALSFTVQVPSAQAAGTWQPDMSWSTDELGLRLQETFGGEVTFLTAITERGPNKLPDQKLCEDGYGKAPCNFANNRSGVWGAVLMPACTSTKEFNCIEDLSVWNSTGVKTSAQFVRQVEGSTFPENTQRRLSKGSTVSIWDAPSQPHLGQATTYAAYVKLGIGFGNGLFGYSNLHATIVPFTLEDSPGATAAFPSQSNNPDGFTEVSPGGQEDNRCVFTETDTCGVIQDFAPDTRASMRIRLSKDIAGWFKGRMKDPNIKINSFSSIANLVEVEASPVNVPKPQAKMPKSQITPALRAFYKKFNTENTEDEWGPLSLIADNPDVLKGLELFKEAAKDSAAGYHSYWSFSSINLDERTSICLASSSRLLGIVTTNSMAYQGGVPKFSRGFLNYEVAGMHLEPDGKTPILGSYDLVMRSDTARCLYGFSRAPLSATVSVTNNKGAKTTATTVVSEKNGWLKMAAYGFTFSNKTIKVKITKKAVKKKKR